MKIPQNYKGESERTKGIHLLTSLVAAGALFYGYAWKPIKSFCSEAEKYQLMKNSQTSVSYAGNDKVNYEGRK